MFNLAASAQPQLILSKLGKRNKVIFYEGEEIRLKVNGADNYVGGFIIGLRDSLIRFRYFDIRLDEISEVDISGKDYGGFNVTQYGPMLMFAGILYIGIDLLNQGDVTTGTFIQGGAISGAGLGLYLLRRKKFKVRKRNRIRIVNL
ncbi:MAG: hypothetical protein WBA74_26540 [Cyclobacteriaceae bacterium]